MNNIIKNKVINKIFLEFMTLFILIIFAFLIGSIVILVAGDSPISAYLELFKGAFGTTGNIGSTITRSIPIIITGIAYAISFKSGVYNLGVEGQMIIGALTCAVTANLLGEFEPTISMLVIVMAGCLSGGIFALLCASLQVYLRVPILISSLLFNYIINLFASYMVIFPLRDKSGGSGVAQTAMIAERLRLPVLLQGTRLHLGVVFILLLPLIAYWLFKKTVLGYEMSMSGINPDFAECSGIQMKRNLMLTMFISGCIGGLAGVVQVLGVDYRYRDGIIFSTGYAWTGFIAAQLTSFEPLPILLTGSFLSALSVGAAGLQRNTLVPAQLADVVQAVIIFMFALREKTTNFLKSKLDR